MSTVKLHDLRVPGGEEIATFEIEDVPSFCGADLLHAYSANFKRDRDTLVSKMVEPDVKVHAEALTAWIKRDATDLSSMIIAYDYVGGWWDNIFAEMPDLIEKSIETDDIYYSVRYCKVIGKTFYNWNSGNQVRQLSYVAEVTDKHEKEYQDDDYYDDDEIFVW